MAMISKNKELLNLIKRCNKNTLFSVKVDRILQVDFLTWYKNNYASEVELQEYSISSTHEANAYADAVFTRSCHNFFDLVQRFVELNKQELVTLLKLSVANAPDLIHQVQQILLKSNDIRNFFVNERLLDESYHSSNACVM